MSSVKSEAHTRLTSDWCEVSAEEVPPVDLINLDASIKLSDDYLDRDGEELGYKFKVVSSRLHLLVRWIRVVFSVLCGSLEQRTVYYLGPAFTGRLLFVRRLSMFTGVVAPVVLGQFAQMFLRGGE
ncbi:hypothetical protein RRG08_030646 [Elysia crispata]|uniref:Uncharacterized protein n=1 Tax=Elysia crispata TaxID=231223 RepID=A0AAE0YQ51_9GAST|nr:hypothetical protein RRG08_030646 [Elysia crispata]